MCVAGKKRGLIYVRLSEKTVCGSASLHLLKDWDMSWCVIIHHKGELCDQREEASVCLFTQIRIYSIIQGGRKLRERATYVTNTYIV